MKSQPIPDTTFRNMVLSMEVCIEIWYLYGLFQETKIYGKSVCLHSINHIFLSVYIVDFCNKDMRKRVIPS